MLRMGACGPSETGDPNEPTTSGTAWSDAESLTTGPAPTTEPPTVAVRTAGYGIVPGTTLDADALPRIIEGLRARGYEFAALATLVR